MPTSSTMINELLTLTWVDWKRLKSGILYWLRFLGVTGDGGRLYLIYVLGFWGFWLLAMWSFAVEQVYQISRTLTPTMTASLGTSIPIGVAVIQFLYLVMLLRDSPLKLMAQEIAYIAASPIRRGTMVLENFIRTLFFPSVFLAAVNCLLSMLLNWGSVPEQVGVIGLQVLLFTAPLIYLSAAPLWICVLLKARPMPQATRLLFWLIIPLLALVVGLVPAIGLWTGQLWRALMTAPLSPGTASSLLTALVTMLTLLYFVGNRVDMAFVADGSQAYARIQRLGMWGQFFERDVIARAKHQTQLIKLNQLGLSLSENAGVHRAGWERALLTLLRLSPKSLFQLFMRGMTLTLLLLLIIQLGEWQKLQTWLFVLLILSQGRPTELVEQFRQDVTQPFLRQFLPTSIFRIFTADTLYPLLVSSLGSWCALLVSFGFNGAALFPLALMIIVALGLCQALELVIEQEFFHRRIPYTYAVIVSSIPVIAAGYLFRSFWAATAAAVFVNLCLAVLLYHGSVDG
ncbi:MAG: hypothetical protein U0694_05230 [Anaerolineae bacterium]